MSSDASSGTGVYVNARIYVFEHENIISLVFTGLFYDVDLNPNWALEA